MFIVYTPEDDPNQRQEWEFVPGRVRQSQAEIVEKQYGESWEKFIADVQSGSMKARRVLLWHLMTRQHHTLKLADVPDFYAEEVVMEHSAAELAVIRERVASTALPPRDMEHALALVDSQIEAANARADVLTEGKATSNSDA